MRLLKRISFIIPLLFVIQSYLCDNNTFSFNETSTIGDDVIGISLDNKSLIPKTIAEYPLPINIHTKYTTDKEDYTSTESIAFSIRTNQQILKPITILAGFAYENINYVFNIESGRLKIIFSQNDFLTTKNDSELINDGQWHRLIIERSNRKLNFTLDNIEQSHIELSDGWQMKRNIFIGAELTPAPNSDYNGDIGDITVINSNQTLNLREEDNFKDSTTALNQSESIQTLAFLPNDNNEIIFPSPIKSPFETLSFSFRTYSNFSTLIQFEQIKLNIDLNGYLTLIIQDKPVPNKEQKPIKHGYSYFVELKLNNQTLEAWIDKNRQSTIELSSSFLIIENFIFGLNNQFIGCIENLTYNNQRFSFQNLSLNRQECSSNSITIKSRKDIQTDQIISFKEYDRPLIITLNNPEEFQIFSLIFYTQESNSIICSLADKDYENFILLSIRDGYLFLTYTNNQNKRIEILMNNSINDRNEHKIIIKKDLLFELDGNIVTKNITERFYINRIYIGKLDGFIQERFSDFDGENFIGCIKDIILNDKSLNYPLDRLTNTCQFTKRQRKNAISYVPPNISLSIRDYRDIIELEIPSNDEFYHYQIIIKTRSLDGIITSIYSNDDRHSLILYLQDGKLQLRYHSSDNITSQLIFDDNQIINDGQEHYISISRQLSSTQIDRRNTQITIPLALSLFFDIITIGGTSNNIFIGCFSNVTYNHHPLLPEGIVQSDHYDCYYDEDSICDRQISCNNIQPLEFCGENDCSLVCTPSLIDNNNKGLLEYSSQIKSGQSEVIYLTIFTTSGNSTLFMTSNGSIQVSIIFQNYYARLIIQNGGIIYTYDFPGRIRGDQWHVLQCQKTYDTIDLTFDDETRHYTNLTEYFSLFGNKKIHICGQNFIGYVQDIILMSDNHHENLIKNSIHNPGLIDYDPSVTWNNRANIPESEAAPPPSSQYEARPAGSMPCYLGCWSPCERIQCLNGGYCIQPTTQTTLAYCHCPSQYTGYRCEQSAVVVVDPCAKLQCNHGTCQKDRGSQAFCSCFEGYGGSRCETQIDPCARVNCNYGRCELDRSRPVCRCTQGYTGHECLTPLDACARVSCNHGTCISQDTTYRCECQRGYEGSACDRALNPCSNFVCYNGGVCHSQGNVQPVCQCTPGYRGANCYEADVDPCVRFECYGGSCTNDRGVARCVCPTGRAGSRCQEDICVLYPCSNSGQCVPEGGSRRCICSNPYYGDDCREVYRPNPCDNVYCGYGQCREGSCECHGGYTGSRCDVAPDLCASVNCNYGTCYEARCTCYEGYTGSYCDTQTTTVPPAPQVAQTPRPLLTPQTVGLIGPKTGQLIDYGRLAGARAGPIGWILALVAGLLLLPLALAFAARQCTQGACIPAGRGKYIPVTTGTARNVELIDQRGELGGMETTRIEQTREVVREYGAMAAASGAVTNLSTMSSGYGDAARENQQQQQAQQTSSGFSQQHIIETDYHVPPVADFGYSRGGLAEGYRDTFESWEAAGAGGYSMNAMFGEGGLQTDYELSNINSVSMTPNGKYAIVGQSQGPPQIWDAVNGQLVSSMHGTSTNCSKVALACSGTLLVGLASDGIDAQPSILQIWDVNTGKPVQLTHQIKCATFTLSNNSSSLVMAGNQKYGRGISVGILDLNNSELTKEIKSDTNQSYGGTPSFITLTPDERFAIVGCSSGSTTNYVVFDLITQQELIQPPMLTLDCEAKTSIVLNNEQILTGTRNGQLILWDIPSCQRIHTLNDNGQNAHRDRITDLKISPDRTHVVSTSADGTAKVWDTNSKEIISRLVGHKREITCACVSANQLVATGSKDQTICLWRTQTGQVASTMPVGMTPLDIHMAAHNRTVVAIGDKDGERQLLMLRVVSIQR